MSVIFVDWSFLYYPLPFLQGGGGRGWSRDQFFSPQEALGEICVLAWEFKAILLTPLKSCLPELAEVLTGHALGCRRQV